MKKYIKVANDNSGLNVDGMGMNPGQNAVQQSPVAGLPGIGNAPTHLGPMSTKFPYQGAASLGSGAPGGGQGQENPYAGAANISGAGIEDIEASANQLNQSNPLASVEQKMTKPALPNNRMLAPTLPPLGEGALNPVNKYAAQDNSKPQISSTGEDNGVSFTTRDEDHATGTDAWKSLSKFMKTGQEVKTADSFSESPYSAALILAALGGAGGAGIGGISNALKGKSIGRGAVTGGLTGLGAGAGVLPGMIGGIGAGELGMLGDKGMAPAVLAFGGGSAAGAGLGGLGGYELSQLLMGDEDKDEREKKAVLSPDNPGSMEASILLSLLGGLGGSAMGGVSNAFKGEDIGRGMFVGGMTGAGALGGAGLGSHGGLMLDDMAGIRDGMEHVIPALGVHAASTAAGGGLGGYLGNRLGNAMLGPEEEWETKRREEKKDKKKKKKEGKEEKEGIDKYVKSAGAGFDLNMLGLTPSTSQYQNQNPKHDFSQYPDFAKVNKPFQGYSGAFRHGMIGGGRQIAQDSAVKQYLGGKNKQYPLPEGVQPWGMQDREGSKGGRRGNFPSFGPPSKSSKGFDKYAGADAERLALILGSLVTGTAGGAGIGAGINALRGDPVGRGAATGAMTGFGAVGGSMLGRAGASVLGGGRPAETTTAMADLGGGVLGGMMGYEGAQQIHEERESDRMVNQFLGSVGEDAENMSEEELQALATDYFAQNVKSGAEQPAGQLPRHDCHGVHPDQTHEEWVRQEFDNPPTRDWEREKEGAWWDSLRPTVIPTQQVSVTELLKEAGYAPFQCAFFGGLSDRGVPPELFLESIEKAANEVGEEFVSDLRAVDLSVMAEKLAQNPAVPNPDPMGRKPPTKFGEPSVDPPPTPMPKPTPKPAAPAAPAPAPDPTAGLTPPKQQQGAPGTNAAAGKKPWLHGLLGGGWGETGKMVHSGSKMIGMDFMIDKVLGEGAAHKMHPLLKILMFAGGGMGLGGLLSGNKGMGLGGLAMAGLPLLAQGFMDPSRGNNAAGGVNPAAGGVNPAAGGVNPANPAATGGGGGGNLVAPLPPKQNAGQMVKELLTLPLEQQQARYAALPDKARLDKYDRPIGTSKAELKKLHDAYYGSPKTDADDGDNWLWNVGTRGAGKVGNQLPEGMTRDHASQLSQWLHLNAGYPGQNPAMP